MSAKSRLETLPRGGGRNYGAPGAQVTEAKTFRFALAVHGAAFQTAMLAA
jgi:hypothetical protein